MGNTFTVQGLRFCRVGRSNNFTSTTGAVSLKVGPTLLSQQHIDCELCRAGCRVWRQTIYHDGPIEEAAAKALDMLDNLLKALVVLDGPWEDPESMGLEIELKAKMTDQQSSRWLRHFLMRDAHRRGE